MRAIENQLDGILEETAAEVEATGTVNMDNIHLIPDVKYSSR